MVCSGAWDWHVAELGFFKKRQKSCAFALDSRKLQGYQVQLLADFFRLMACPLYFQILFPTYILVDQLSSSPWSHTSQKQRRQNIIVWRLPALSHTASFIEQMPSGYDSDNHGAAQKWQPSRLNLGIFVLELIRLSLYCLLNLSMGIQGVPIIATCDIECSSRVVTCVYRTVFIAQCDRLCGIQSNGRLMVRLVTGSWGPYYSENELRAILKTNNLKT